MTRILLRIICEPFIDKDVSDDVINMIFVRTEAVSTIFCRVIAPQERK